MEYLHALAEEWGYFIFKFFGMTKMKRNKSEN